MVIIMETLYVMLSEKHRGLLRLEVNLNNDARKQTKEARCYIVAHLYLLMAD